MKKLFKLMMFNAPLRADEGADGADGGGSDKGADLAAQVAALSAQLEELKKAHSAPANPPSDAEKLRAELEATKTWLTARDSEVRESHAELDGETRAANEVFSNGLSHPGDPAAINAGEVCNCRCTILLNYK